MRTVVALLQPMIMATTRERYARFKHARATVVPQGWNRHLTSTQFARRTAAGRLKLIGILPKNTSVLPSTGLTRTCDGYIFAATRDLRSETGAGRYREGKTMRRFVKAFSVCSLVVSAVFDLSD